MFLQSRWHGVLSRRLLLVTVTGRRSGRTHTLPVAYTERGDVLAIRVGAAARKRWWRNVVCGAPVRVWLRGTERTGRAVSFSDATGDVTVEVSRDPPVCERLTRRLTRRVSGQLSLGRPPPARGSGGRPTRSTPDGEAGV
jgi:hypothetical protein